MIDLYCNSWIKQMIEPPHDPLDFDHVLDAIRAADIVEAAKLFRHCLSAAYTVGQKDLIALQSGQKTNACSK